MSTSYKILIVSNKQNDVLEIQSKLSISRSEDSIISCTLDKAVESCRKSSPDIVIIFAHEKNDKLFEICKIIRLDPLLKNISIVFIFNQYDENFILESLNAGANDYIISPIKKIDILAHLTWCLKRSELIHKLDIKEALLKDIGVIDRNIGIYQPWFVHVVFNHYINEAKSNGSSLIFMAISPDSQYKNKINSDYLSKVVKKSVRSTDVIGLSEEGHFYILLPEIDIKGTYVVYNRISANLGNIFTTSAGICEFCEGMNYESISSLAAKALSEAIANGGNRILVYNSELLKSEVKSGTERYKASELATQNSNKDYSEIPESEVTKNWIDKVQETKKNYESFRKEFIKKINNTVSPVFYKMRDNLRIKYPASIIIDYCSSDTRCEFSIKEIYEGTESSIQIIDPGLSNIKIEHCLIKSGKQTITRYSIDLNNFTDIYLERTLQDMFNEFEIVSDLERLVRNDQNL